MPAMPAAPALASSNGDPEVLTIGKRFDIQHDMFDEESRQLSRLLAIETLIETLHSKFPDR